MKNFFLFLRDRSDSNIFTDKESVGFFVSDDQKGWNYARVTSITLQSTSEITHRPPSFGLLWTHHHLIIITYTKAVTHLSPHAVQCHSILVSAKFIIKFNKRKLIVGLQLSLLFSYNPSVNFTLHTPFFGPHTSPADNFSNTAFFFNFLFYFIF